jgi:TonB family protein
MTPRNDSAGFPPTAGDRLTCSLIRRAARSAPAALSERLEEEWLADLAAQRGAFSRLRFALGCCWATRVIAHEFLAPSVVAVSSSAGQASVAAFAPHDSNFLSRRMAIFLVIVGLHVILIYGFASGFAVRIIKVRPPATGVMIDLPKPVPLPPPAIPPTVEKQPFADKRDLLKTLDPPPINIVPTLEDTVTVVTEPPPHSEAPPTVVRHVGGPGAGFPDTDEYYPSSARRAGENGAATVQVCVGESGRLISNPTITQSSGSARLDDGALKLAKAGSGHYRATTEDGRPVNDCYSFRIRFELRE